MKQQASHHCSCWRKAERPYVERTEEGIRPFVHQMAKKCPAPLNDFTITAIVYGLTLVESDSEPFSQQ